MGETLQVDPNRNKAKCFDNVKCAMLCSFVNSASKSTLDFSFILKTFVCSKYYVIKILGDQIINQ